jgi:hypothetical protein
MIAAAGIDQLVSIRVKPPAGAFDVKIMGCGSRSSVSLAWL